MFANIKEKAKDNIKPLLKSVSIGASAVGVCLQILEFLHFKIPSYLPIILFGFTAILLFIFINLKHSFEEKITMILSSDVQEMRTIRLHIDDEIERQTIRGDPHFGV